MKKGFKLEEDNHDYPETLKAAAQAWHAHSGNSNTPNEHDALRRPFRTRPTRFKLEASKKCRPPTTGDVMWDFGRSLWDSYEIVAVSRRIETGLALDHPFSGDSDASIPTVKKKREESKNSLRNLFNQVSSRRFDEADVPR